jgi:hypothetical protein
MRNFLADFNFIPSFSSIKNKQILSGPLRAVLFSRDSLGGRTNPTEVFACIVFIIKGYQFLELGIATLLGNGPGIF